MHKHRYYFPLLFLLCLFLSIPTPQAHAEKEIHALVLTDRTATRMESKIYHCFVSAALTAKTSEPVEFVFSAVNPAIPQAEPVRQLEQAMDAVRHNLAASVDDIIDLRKRLKPAQSMVEAVEQYIQSHPESSLGKASQGLTKIMTGYDFLIVEPTYETVIHPLFYNPEVKEVEMGYASLQDVKDTLCGLLLIRAALEQGVIVFGTCHGAQLGWLLAGGGLTRVSKYTGDEPMQAYYLRRNPHGYGTEIWWFNSMLNNDDPIHQHRNTNTVYPLPEPFAQGREGLYIIKEVNHTLAMTPPIPANADVFSYHPLSVNQPSDAELEITGPIPGYPLITESSRKKFKDTLKKLTIVDAYKYKTLYGFQYHPQEAHDELDIPVLFEYLVNLVASRISVEQ